MNKILSIILILSSVFMLSCHRDPEPNVIDHEFTDVKAVPQFTTCDISCQNLSVQQRENVHARVLYSLHEDLKEVETIPMEEDDSCLTCQVTGLAEGTLYYYTFEAYTSVEAYRAKEIYHFTTQVSSGISVTTGEVTDITQTTAKGRGMVTAAEGVTVTERGLCWGTGHNPTVQGSHSSNGYGTGEYIVMMPELSPNTQYYVRAYAVSTTGTEYGAEVNFVTNGADLPEVVTGQVTGITATTAVGHGQVISEGTSPVTERGVCWSTGHDPLVSDSHSNAGTGMGNFSVTLSGLTPNATYYLRAYATNEHGTAYGAEVSFKALEGQPEVETVSVTDITASSAIGHGKVTAQGGSAITARGFCWSTEHNPTTESSHIAAGEGMGEFDATIVGLAANTRYYLRAYATNGQGTTYGSELEFTTAATKPTVTTGSVEGTLAHGEVTDDGGSAVTERGICWSTGHEPTTEGLHANNGTGTGSFSVQMTGLTPGTTYYVRAYAKNSAGTAYGSEVSFTTQSGGGSGTLTFTANGVSFEMIYVEGGTFWMGAQSTNPSGQNYDSEAYNGEQPVHQVTLSSYHIGKFEVTQELWQAVMGSNPSQFTGNSQRPVEMVSWNDCQAFITALNELCAGQLNGKHFALPTEAQWEFAARGGKHSQGYKYSGSNTIGDVAWYDSNSGMTTHAVGTKTPNELGLYDMSGNVYEWCSDRYGSYGSGAQTDPTGPASGSSRARRGGNWIISARDCRVSKRVGNFPNDTYDNIGLRLAL